MVIFNARSKIHTGFFENYNKTTQSYIPTEISDVK